MPLFPGLLGASIAGIVLAPSDSLADTLAMLPVEQHSQAALVSSIHNQHSRMRRSHVGNTDKTIVRIK
jgi:hypothetical protein